MFDKFEIGICVGHVHSLRKTVYVVVVMDFFNHISGVAVVLTVYSVTNLKLGGVAIFGLVSVFQISYCMPHPCRVVQFRLNALILHFYTLFKNKHLLRQILSWKLKKIQTIFSVF